ncbi:MAG: Rrf2 family transcriptional regulator [Clostridiales Family XIII bacterium]|jgi:Rrf2 family protein|nr:Rrf2 family transcriptional regulator [Clostridiales Family XIII bacterium]
MKISVKGRYALAAMIQVADWSARGENVSVNNIADKLGISKIYLEQVFGQLKKSELLTSIKGPKGGYRLAREASGITVWDILSTIEQGLTEKTEETVTSESPEIELVMRGSVYSPLDKEVRRLLTDITVGDLLDEVRAQEEQNAFMLNM